MSPSASDYTPVLRSLMQRRGVASFKALSQAAGVSERQIKQLRRGRVDRMQLRHLQQLSQALHISLVDFVQSFSDLAIDDAAQPSSQAVQQEYQRLQAQLVEQRSVIWQEFQRSTLQALESWLIQFPTAAYAAQQNPQVPAARLLPLMRPIEQLLKDWNVEAIAAVGSEIPFDPQQHQLMEGTAQVGERVRVRYTGYRQGDRLLHRAKVSPLPRS